MGVGDSLEAAFTMAGPIGAGTWHLIGDGIVFIPVDVTYDVLWRAGGTDTVIATWQHHFDPRPAGPQHFFATPFEADAPGIAVAAQAGDQLVLRFSAAGDADAGLPGNPTAFTPNGDSNTSGNIPSLVLPK